MLDHRARMESGRKEKVRRLQGGAGGPGEPSGCGEECRPSPGFQPSLERGQVLPAPPEVPGGSPRVPIPEVTPQHSTEGS